MEERCCEVVVVVCVEADFLRGWFRDNLFVLAGFVGFVCGG